MGMWMGERLSVCVCEWCSVEWCVSEGVDLCCVVGFSSFLS